ncbi:MAG TPA: twin-arginine translocation signal domain-containing protein [Acidobacteriota bacterium]|nr:twin-arginine translocation signal domain-containing protein [Acidobacteriota bacterium]
MERRSFLKGIAAAVGASVVNPSYAGNLIAGHAEGDIYEIKQSEVLSTFDILNRLKLLPEVETKFEVESSYGISTAKNVITFGKNTLLENISFESLANIGYVPLKSELFLNGTKLGAKRYFLRDDDYLIDSYNFETNDKKVQIAQTEIRLTYNEFMKAKTVFTQNRLQIVEHSNASFNAGPIPQKMSGIVCKLA